MQGSNVTREGKKKKYVHIEKVIHIGSDTTNYLIFEN